MQLVKDLNYHCNCCHGMGLIPGLGTSICCGHGRKKKREREKQMYYKKLVVTLKDKFYPVKKRKKKTIKFSIYLVDFVKFQVSINCTCTLKNDFSTFSIFMTLKKIIPNIVRGWIVNVFLKATWHSKTSFVNQEHFEICIYCLQINAMAYGSFQGLTQYQCFLLLSKRIKSLWLLWILNKIVLYKITGNSRRGVVVNESD